MASTTLVISCLFLFLPFSLPCLPLLAFLSFSLSFCPSFCQIMSALPHCFPLFLSSFILFLDSFSLSLTNPSIIRHPRFPRLPFTLQSLLPHTSSSVSFLALFLAHLFLTVHSRSSVSRSPFSPHHLSVISPSTLSLPLVFHINSSSFLHFQSNYASH